MPAVPRPRPLRLAALGLALLAGLAQAATLDDARKRIAANDLDGAAELLEDIVEATPTDAAAHHLLGGVYGRQAQSANLFSQARLAGKTRAEFERAVALAPDNVDYRESLFQYYAIAPAIVGGGVEKARVQAVEIAKRDALRGDFAWATLARIEKKPDEALKHLRAAATRRPDDAKVALQVGMQIGLLLQELKRWDEAFSQFETLTGRDPAALGAWYQFGRTAVLANTRHAEGEAAFKRYLAGSPAENDPPLAAAHWRLGMLYELMKRVADARAEYESALRLDPKHAEAKAALAKLK